MVWNKMNKDQFCEKFYDKHEKNRRFEVLGDYINTSTPILIRHIDCDFEFYRSPEKLLSRGATCPNCNPLAKTRRTQEEFENEVHQKTNGEYKVVGKYRNVDSKVKLEHLKCGYVWSVVATSFLNGNSRCPKCAKGGVKLTNEEFLNIISNIEDSNEYVFMEKYKSYDEKLQVKHIVCGYSYKVSPNKFIQGRRCPKCRETKGERSISNFLDELNIKHIKEKTFDSLRDKWKLRFDFYIKTNDLEFLIEYDGIQHFQPIKWNSRMKEEDVNSLFEKTMYRDNIKNLYAKNNKITLYRIPHTEIDNIHFILNDILEKERSTTIPRGSTLKATVSGNGERVTYTMI